MANPSCPHCGRSDWEAGPKFNGHVGWCAQHPERWGKGSQQKEKATPTPKEDTPTTQPGTPPSKTDTTIPTQPITFTFTEGEKLPAQQEIPEFKPPEEAAKPEQTQKATLAEERGAGVAAISALVLPLFEMWNRTLEGQSALPASPADMKLTKTDAENLAQGIILVDAKHGGIISKSFGSDEYGAELFLAGISVGIGIKMVMALRLRQQRGSRPKSAGPSPEEIPRQPLLAKATEGIRNIFTPKAQPKKEEGKEEGAMTSEDFMAMAEERRREMGG